MCKISEQFINCDSPYDHVRQRCEAMLTQEIDLAIHLGIERIMITLPDLEECESVDNLARILNKYLEEITIMQKFIVKLTIPGDDQEAE